MVWREELPLVVISEVAPHKQFAQMIAEATVIVNAGRKQSK